MTLLTSNDTHKASMERGQAEQKYFDAMALHNHLRDELYKMKGKRVKGVINNKCYQSFKATTTPIRRKASDALIAKKYEFKTADRELKRIRREYTKQQEELKQRQQRGESLAKITKFVADLSKEEQQMLKKYVDEVISYLYN